MLHKISKAINGEDRENRTFRGRVVLMKKNVLDFNDLNASILDRVHELFGKKVSLQLISAVNSQSSAGTWLFW